MRAVVLLLLWLSTAHAVPAESLEPEPGTTVEGELAPGDARDFFVALAADRLVHVVVDQRGVDVEAALHGPDGHRLVTSDRPISYQGPEELLAVSARAGVHRIALRALEAARPAGRFELRIEALRPPTAADRRRAAAAARLADGDAALGRGDVDAAVDAYRRAREEWREAGDAFREAEALARLGRAHGRARSWTDAAASYRAAAARFREAGDDRWQAIALASLGTILSRQRERDLAILQYERARPLSRRAGDRRHAAIAAYGLGQIRELQGEPQRAIDDYREALELLDEARDRELWADVQYLLGVLYRRLGHWPPAAEALRAAERAYTEVGDPGRRATALNQLGQLFHDQGALPAALASYRQALELRRRLGDARGEAISLRNVGRVHQEMEEWERAAEHYERALAILAGEDRPADTARVWLARGTLLARRGEPRAAIDSFREALALFQGESDRVGELEALAGVAAAERRLGRLAAARAGVEEALARVEAARPRLLRQDLRTAFFATVRDHYELYVDLLMEMGHAGAAFEASERARSRSLLDLLAEAGAEETPDPRLRQRRREIQRRLNEQADRRLEVLGAGGRVAAIDRRIRALIEELETVDGEIRRRREARAAEPLRLAELQREIADDGLLLAYGLGDERSFLWASTGDALASFELPARGEIEALVRAAHEHLGRGRRPASRMAADRALCTLSRHLLGPAAELLAGRRLLIVPDGVLAYLPFAALPLPAHADGCAAPPLVAGHEITYVHSVSVLAALRREHATRPAPPGTLAVVADPVFGPDDARLTGAPRTGAPRSGPALASALTRSAADLGVGPFARLVHTGREAETLLGLVPPRRSFRALGLAATKETVTSGRLAGYRWVHLATHGLLNPVHPELSGLVFSLVDADGAPRDGFLRAHEIRYLELPADLAVLSACQTALGKEVRGEGLMGLTRAFFHAGSRRVMVSLWPVGDLGTAELMERFYRRLLDGQRPAAALREAQLSMWRQEAWSAPYHWAGFVIQGEPR